MSFKILILQEKLKAKNGVVGIIELISNKIKKIRNKGGQNTLEGILLYTDFYLDLLLANESEFSCIKPREQINKIQIFS